MPNVLYGKLKAKALEQQTTMRDLIIQAVEAALAPPERPSFQLRDASVGSPHGDRSRRITPDDVNAAIDGIREGLSR